MSSFPSSQVLDEGLSKGASMMKHRVGSLLLGLGFMLLAIGSAIGQQSSSPEVTEIKQIRAEIRSLAAKPPQSESRLALLNLRVRLAGLLNQQLGALKKDIRDRKLPKGSAALQG